MTEKPDRGPLAKALYASFCLAALLALWLITVFIVFLIVKLVEAL